MPYEWYGEKIRRNIDGKIVDNLYRAALMVEGDAKRICPVDTGRLRASITHEVNAEEQRALVGSDVQYAPYVELGTYKMAPQPYLRPALWMNKNNIKHLFGIK